MFLGAVSLLPLSGLIEVVRFETLYSFERPGAPVTLFLREDVSGFTGEQFARPEALELLRAMRRQTEKTATIPVSNADPLNLTGIILPGPQ
jgi:ATP-dependent Lhr-like helicase